jgi:hypothetical protein
MRMQHLSKIIKTVDSEHLSEYQPTNQFNGEYDPKLLAAERIELTMQLILLRTLIVLFATTKLTSWNMRMVITS